MEISLVMFKERIKFLNQTMGDGLKPSPIFIFERRIIMKYDEMTKEEQKEKFCKENGSYLYYFKKDDMELVGKKL